MKKISIIVTALAFLVALTQCKKEQATPANDGKSTMTKEQIRAIADPVARQKAMLENASLFGLPEATE